MTPVLNFVNAQPLRFELRQGEQQLLACRRQVQPRRPQQQQVWVMKTRSNKSNKRNKGNTSGGTTTLSSGAGFGKGGGSDEGEQKQKQTKKMGNSSSSSSSSSVQAGGTQKEIVQQGTGSSGDSTPHRVDMSDNPVEKLVDPSKGVVEDQAPPLVALPILSEEELRDYRYPIDTPMDTLIEKFTDIVSNREEGGDTVSADSIIVANRHHISESLLFRLTSYILKTESEVAKFKRKSQPSSSSASTLSAPSFNFGFNFNRRKQTSDNDDDEDDDESENDSEIRASSDSDEDSDLPAEVQELAGKACNLRHVRKTLVAYSWSFDYAFKRAVMQAEARLLKVLQSSNMRKGMEENGGRSTLEVNAMWTVVYAAVAAWEERGRENAALVNVDTQKALTEAAGECRREGSKFQRLLSDSLKNIQNILLCSNSAEQQAIVDDMSEDVIIETICYLEALRLLPTPSYGGLTERIDTIVDYIRNSAYGMERLSLSVEPVRFEPTEIERSSRLVRFSRRSSDQSKKSI